MRELVAYLFVAALVLASLCARSSEVTCTDLYFLNAVLLTSEDPPSRILYLEVPVNFSKFGINQEVRLVLSRGVLQGSAGEYYIEVDPGRVTYAYVLLRVVTCSPNLASDLEVLRTVLSDPGKASAIISRTNAEVPREFVGRYPEPVASAIMEAFESWLKSLSWYSSGDIVKNPLVLSAFAAKFMYLGGYIKYSPSLVPKPPEEVVSSREGDCDDMSRLLMILLWAYEIPAVMLLGFTSIPDFRMSSTLGSFEYAFLNGGPHAFVLAYAPGYGWLSLDLLAGSLLTQPFIVWGYAASVEVSRESVESFVELHRRIEGKQLMALFHPGDPVIASVEALEAFINATLGVETEPHLEEAARPSTKARGVGWGIVVIALAAALVTLSTLLAVRARRWFALHSAGASLGTSSRIKGSLREVLGESPWRGWSRSTSGAPSWTSRGSTRSYRGSSHS